jgi:hypothetical protein
MSKTPEELAEEYCASPYEKDAFLAGYKAAQEHAHAALEEAEARMQELQDQIAGVSKVMPQWISVKDKLPELRQEVLVWYDNGYEVAYLQKFEPPKLQYPQFNNVEMFEWCFGDFEDFDVTHWMPLPDMPKEEE